MAATIKSSTALEIKDTTTKIDSPDPVLTKTETQSVQAMDDKVVIVGQAAEEDLSFAADLATPGWCELHNLDPTNFVTYGPKSGGVMVAFGKIKAGDRHLFRFAGSVTLRWQANTADCRVRIRIFND